MRSLLFLSHRIPFPPNKGDKIRAFRILEHLAKSYRVHLGCFIDDPDDWAYRGELEKICAEVQCFDRPSGRAWLGAAWGLVTGQALSLAMFDQARMGGWVRQTIHKTAPHAVFGFSSAVAQYLLNADLGQARVIMDFVDVDSDKWRQYAAEASPPKSWVYAREAKLLLDFDRRMAKRSDGAVFVSDAEAALFRKLAPESASKTFGVANGIDCDYFSPAHDFLSPFSGPGPHLVFTGTMDYRPNIDAVVWFATEILPLVQKRLPHATFAIVGAKPTRDVTVLAKIPAVMVTGKVDDVRPYLKHASVVVAPLRLARGIQNKVMEGMAMARPVVTTPQGLEGIDATPGVDILVATSAADIASQIEVALKPESSALAVAGRKLMAESYVWSSQLARLDQLLAG